MNKKIKIKLNDFLTIKDFAQDIVTFESDVNIIKGSVVYDAKSILAVLSLDPTSSTYIEIISDNDTEIERFNDMMEKYRVQ